PGVPGAHEESGLPCATRGQSHHVGQETAAHGEAFSSDLLLRRAVYRDPGFTRHFRECGIPPAEHSAAGERESHSHDHRGADGHAGLRRLHLVYLQRQGCRDRQGNCIRRRHDGGGFHIRHRLDERYVRQRQPAVPGRQDESDGGGSALDLRHRHVLRLGLRQESGRHANGDDAFRYRTRSACETDARLAAGQLCLFFLLLLPERPGGHQHGSHGYNAHWQISAEPQLHDPRLHWSRSLHHSRLSVGQAGLSILRTRGLAIGYPGWDNRDPAPRPRFSQKIRKYVLYATCHSENGAQSHHTTLFRPAIGWFVLRQRLLYGVTPVTRQLEYASFWAGTNSALALQ